MEFKILDSKEEENSRCFLVSVTLEDYIENIPSDYSEYEIQRSIVSNSYLDRLVHTVLKKGHIPSITLITDDQEGSILDGSVSRFKILDGLQRTHRLKIIYETKKLFLEHVDEIYRDVSDFKIKRSFRDQLSNIGSSGNIFIAIKDFYFEHGLEALNSCFSDSKQWFEIWSGLSPEDEVKKMLVLNAGHKPVNIKHQLELLFQNLYPIIDKVKSGNIKIVREKDVSSAAYSKLNEVGTYHFTHLISALISYLEKKPVTTNSNFIAKVQDDDSKLKDFANVFSYSFLESFIDAVYLIDTAATKSYGDVGTRWVRREVSLVSLFAVIGSFANNIEEFNEIIRELVANFNKCNLEQYEICRNQVDLAKVNIGNINKKNIYAAFESFIRDGMSKSINWDMVFQGE